MTLINKSVTILYFATLREATNCSDELIEIPEQMTLKELYTLLTDKYRFDLSEQRVRVAINHQFCSWDEVINNKDVIAFIPPVAGG